MTRFAIIHHIAMHIMAKNGFHHQLISSLINELITRTPLSKVDGSVFGEACF